jgi:transcriptional regulator GlxA family with amidase domain
MSLFLQNETSECAIMRDVGLIVFPEFSMMSFGVATVFEVANMLTKKDNYRLKVLSETGGPVRSSAGVSVDTSAFGEDRLDTVIVAGGTRSDTPSDGLTSFLRDASEKSRRVASICTGAFVLAEAGLLDGRRATTHWFYARELQTRYPKVKVDDDRIFINDGFIWTSAGMTAGIDLALALVEADHGSDIAKAVAKKLVVYHRRSGGQSQFSALLDLQPKTDRIQTALDFAKRNLHTPLSVEKLAEAAHLSPRQFSRAFRAETGQSPAKAIEKLRVEVARALMEETQHPIEIVSRQTGFADPDRMRRAFLRTYGQPPQVIRRNARASAEM